MEKRLLKSYDRFLTGALGGVAEYFDLDPSLVRIGYAALTLFTVFFPGLVLYIIMAIIIPKKDKYIQSD